LPKQHKNPVNLPLAAATISFYPESAMWREEQPFIIHQVNGRLRGDGTVLLDRRIIGFRGDGVGELVIEIEVNGVQRCKCKAKHAAAAGVMYDEDGWNYYIDKVVPPH
jgi:hypothetical protein